jgi:hypothetical protein
MTPHQRLVLNIARDLQEVPTTGTGSPSGTLLLPERDWLRCRALLGRFEICRARGWQVAARNMRDELRQTVRLYARRLAELSEDLEAWTPPRALPPLGELYREVLAVFDEFDDVTYHPRSKTLSVKSEPIEFEDVALGRFEIRLRLPDIPKVAAGQAFYDVIALTPCRPGTNDSVTHPHVQNDHLCEGDGHRSIQRALAQGRLTDFFQIVLQILATYNGGSAYVPLEDWTQPRCDDCGGTVSADDLAGCARCDREVCDDCRGVCDGCQESCCSPCLTQCAGCPQLVCERCLTVCDACCRTFCADCLPETLCPECHANSNCPTESTSLEKSPGEAGEDLPVSAPDECASSRAPVHADRLGPAPVPA